MGAVTARMFLRVSHEMPKRVPYVGITQPESADFSYVPSTTLFPQRLSLIGVFSSSDSILWYYLHTEEPCAYVKLACPECWCTISKALYSLSLAVRCVVWSSKTGTNDAMGSLNLQQDCFCSSHDSKALRDNMGSLSDVVTAIAHKLNSFTQRND